MPDLSPDQEQAAKLCLDSLAKGQETSLTGPAGSGKTTLTKHIIKAFGKKTVIGCPTGKAALRAQQVTGCPASTLHRLMYKGVELAADGELLFSDLTDPLSASRHLLVVDEVSMMGTKLYKDLRQWAPRTLPILYVGDAEQLEPVRDTWGVDLRNPTAALTQVHRQAQGSPIIDLATAVRQGNGDGWLGQWNPEESEDRVTLQHGLENAIRWHLDRRVSGRDSTLLTYTHQTRRTANVAIRGALGLVGPVCAGDRLMVKVNNRRTGLMNGEVLNVTRVEHRPVFNRADYIRVFTKERDYPLMINTELIERTAGDYWKWWNRAGDDKEYPFVHVWYGDCLTVHSSQGSEWDEVGFIWDWAYKRMRKKEPDAARRFLYTAVTRASKNLAIFAA
jgi:exodeoxyribonuclease-5